MQHWELLLFFFSIAFIYASVGFGGGSSYLALLSLYPLAFQEMRMIALVCNIIVVTGGTIIFIRAGQVKWKKILPLLIGSVPMAFIGGAMKINQSTFFIILGISLIIAASLLWIKTKAPDESSINTPDKTSYLKNGIIGGTIGFLSGMVGIGGGIFLAPLLNLMKWDTSRRIAAAASLFILVNSISGISGQLMNFSADMNYSGILWLGLAVLAGGQLGARMGAVKFDQLLIRRVTALLVFAAGIQVLIKHLY
jgi:uncharacterized protein